MMWACRECGTNISAEAEVCPRCGIRFKPPPPPDWPGAWGRSMVVAQGVFFGLLAWTIFAAVVGVLLFGAIGNAIRAGMQQP